MAHPARFVKTRSAASSRVARAAVKPVARPAARLPAAVEATQGPMALLAAEPAVETPAQKLDRLTQTALAAPWGNLSPVGLTLAWADWAWHLSISPGRQLELAGLATRLAAQAIETARNTVQAAQHSQAGQSASGGVVTQQQHDDPRLRAAGWDQWPFAYWRAGFESAQAFWREAARVDGMSRHHGQMVDFFARQTLEMLSPANGLTNPAVLHDAFTSSGTHLAQGWRNWLADVTHVPTPQDREQVRQFQPGRDVAVTPGKVVFRNHLIELIRYEPQTRTVCPEPVVIVPSWIMKYYILDLSPHNSLVRYLVGQGHTVYMISWCNPEVADRNLGMDNYLKRGVLDALLHVSQETGGAPPHAMGYCLGGTLMAIAAAALARPGSVAGYETMPPLKTLTLLAAQTDFSEPGELGLFIDESQISLLEHLTRQQGYLGGAQMAGSFQFLHSRDLLWARYMREYLLGERDQPNDLMAWNADVTRLPARMYHEYLVTLYLRNALANDHYRVDGRPVSLNDLRLPVFVVGTEKDHVSPWRSVYKIHALTDVELTFVLTSSGHNAGIVSEPGHPRRRYHVATRAERAPWLGADDWLTRARAVEGSWWPAWQQWLAAHSSVPVKAQPIARAIGDAPGRYVHQCYAD